MALGRRPESPDRREQPRPPRPQHPQQALPRLGEKSRAPRGDGPREDRCRSASRDGGILLRAVGIPLATRKTSPRRAPPHQPRARREGRRQRGGHERPPIAQRDDQRGGPPSHAGDLLRAPARQCFRHDQPRGQRTRVVAGFRVRRSPRLSHRLPLECRHRNARLGDASPARARDERPDQ